MLVAVLGIFVEKKVEELKQEENRGGGL